MTLRRIATNVAAATYFLATASQHIQGQRFPTPQAFFDIMTYAEPLTLWSPPLRKNAWKGNETLQEAA